MTGVLAPALLAALAMGRTVEYVRPPLTDYQNAAFFNPARVVLIEGTTKTGKNHAGLVWFFEKAIIGPRCNNFWWAEPVYPQAEISYERLKRAIPEDLRKPNDSERSLQLVNGKKLWFKSMEKPDNLYGEDVGAIVINEASRAREESWWALRTTLTTTQGPIRIMGNLKGKKNWFYRMARRVEGGEQGAAYFKFVSAQAVKAGIIPASEIESARRDLPEAVFRELYLGEATEDGSNPFGMDHIADCVAPLAAGPAVCYGVDLAKSTDHTVIKGLNAAGLVCKSLRFQMPWTETKRTIHETVGDVPTLVDSTGVGDPVLEDLQREADGSNFTGFHFSSRSKQQLIEGLAVAVQQHQTSILEGNHRMEMESFEYQYTRTGVIYSAPEGMHDDEVCAHALAWSHFRGKDSGGPLWRPA